MCFDDRIVIGCRFLPLLLPQIGKGPVTPRVYVFRIQFESATQVLDRRVVLFLPELHFAAAAKGVSVFRVEFDELRIIRDSLVELVTEAVCLRAVPIILRVGRLGIDRLGEFLDSLVILFIPRVMNAAIGMTAGIAGFSLAGQRRPKPEKQADEQTVTFQSANFHYQEPSYKSHGPSRTDGKEIPI